MKTRNKKKKTKQKTKIGFNYVITTVFSSVKKNHLSKFHLYICTEQMTHRTQYWVRTKKLK